jgi:uncharacterized protein
MAKRPAMGRIKRRLARETGASEATRFYRFSLAHTVLRLASDPRWQTVLAMDCAPAEARRFARKGVAVLAQGHGDLGVRMQRLFNRLKPGPVVIVGGDIPAIRGGHIAEAFKLLGSADAVFGPATDGGYWLVGMKRRPRVPKPFAPVRWSTPHALADTRENLESCRVALAATLSDVDRAEDLRSEARAGRLI